MLEEAISSYNFEGRGIGSLAHSLESPNLSRDTRRSGGYKLSQDIAVP